MADSREGMILLDVAADDTFASSFLEDSGHPVVVCHGPADASICPLLDGQGCDKFADAHGVVFELDLERTQHRDILRKYGQLAAEGMPIRVVVTADQAERYGELLAGFEVWTRQPNAADLDGLAAEVEAADRFADIVPRSVDIPETWFG